LASALEDRYEKIKKVEVLGVTPLADNELWKTSNSVSTMKWREYNVFQFHIPELHNLFKAVREMTLEACDYYEIDFEQQQYRVYATNANGNSEFSAYSNSVTTFSFTPFGAFGFTPGSRFCVDEDTPIATVGPNDSVVQKPAKEIQVGERIWAATFDEYIDESKDGYKGYLYSKTLTNIRVVQCTVEGITPSTRNETVIFNNDPNKRFSLTERMLMKRNNIYQYIPSGDVVVGDIYLARNEDNTISEKPITHIANPTETRNVYRYNVEPVDHLFAGDMVVHNYK